MKIILSFIITSNQFYSVIPKGPVAGMVSPSFPDDFEYASTTTSSNFLSFMAGLYADNERPWIPQHRVYEWNREVGDGKVTPMIGVTIAITSGCEKSLVISVEHKFDVDVLQVISTVSQVLQHPHIISNQVKNKLKAEQAINTQHEKELDLAMENVVLRKSGERTKMTKEDNKFGTNQHKAFFKLPLPREVKDNIHSQKIHQIENITTFALVVDLECVVHDDYVSHTVAKASPAKP